MGTRRVVLIRHGVTDFTVTGRWDGRGGLNPPLNDTGRTQANELVSRVEAMLGDDVDTIITSSLNRAIETAQPTAQRLRIATEVDPAWDELAFGQWDGLASADIGRDHPELMQRFMYDETFRVPGGECHIDLHARVRPAFEKLLNRDATTVVVAHWGPIMSVLSLILGIDLGPARRLMLAPTSMTSIGFGSMGPQVEFVNDIGSRR